MGQRQADIPHYNIPGETVYERYAYLGRAPEPNQMAVPRPSSQRGFSMSPEDSAAINAKVVGFGARIMMLSEQANALKNDAVALALDVQSYADDLTTRFPQSESRDGLIAALANMKAALAGLAAIPFP